MLPSSVAAFLNAGVAAVLRLPPDVAGNTCFVRIRPVAKPGVPREERRYLNSTWSMWEYWDFEFRRVVLSSGWASDEWNYDRYIVHDERISAFDPSSFAAALSRWVADPTLLQRADDSDFPE